MIISRYLDVATFRSEASKLKATTSSLDDKDLERLEKQGSLIPRLRLHYPDEIERRWWADSHPEEQVVGALEPDGQRWQDANDLEKGRQIWGWRWYKLDPSTTPYVLDNPEDRFRPFLENPAEKGYEPWNNFRVVVTAVDGDEIYKNDTIITYYSSWQILQFAEVVNMGIRVFMNLLKLDDWPSEEQIAAAPRSMSFLPAHAMRGFGEHAPAFDAIVWFAEEADQGYLYITRKDNGRRLLTDRERDEVERIRQWAMSETQKRHNIGPSELLAAVRFLCEQWAEWTEQGRPLIADAYKAIATRGIQLARLMTRTTLDEYRDLVGYAGGYFKPILDVMWPDWEVEQRQKAKYVLVGFRREKSLLKAEFSDELVDKFLDFIETNNLHGFYWRLESFHRHAFKGNDFSREGLKGDVQGMGVVLEHIVSTLGGSRTQLNEKFKELWANDPDVIKLLKNNEVMKIGQGKTIDLDWFEARNSLSLPEQTAADLAICYAIRGGAHRVIEESNPLKLEHMMLIMLRAAVKTFDAVMKAKASKGNDTHSKPD